MTDKEAARTIAALDLELLIKLALMGWKPMGQRRRQTCSVRSGGLLAHDHLLSVIPSSSRGGPA
jgi:hypothetical protein